MNLFDWLEKFLIYLRIHKQMSDKTLEQYGRHVFRFISYFSPDLPKYCDIWVFLEFLMSKPSYLPKKLWESILQARKSVDMDIEQISLDDINDFRFSLKSIPLCSLCTV